MILCKILNISVASTAENNTSAVAVANKNKSLSAYNDSNVLHTAVNEVNQLFVGKYGLKYSGADMKALQAVAKAAERRSLQEFKEAVSKLSII